MRRQCGVPRYTGEERVQMLNAILFNVRNGVCCTHNLEPLAEVERALLVVEVLHAPHPEGLGLLLVVGGEHFCANKEHSVRNRFSQGRPHARVYECPSICLLYTSPSPRDS